MVMRQRFSTSRVVFVRSRGPRRPPAPPRLVLWTSGYPGETDPTWRTCGIGDPRFSPPPPPPPPPAPARSVGACAWPWRLPKARLFCERARGPRGHTAHSSGHTANGTRGTAPTRECLSLYARSIHILYRSKSPLYGTTGTFSHQPTHSLRVRLSSPRAPKFGFKLQTLLD